MAAHRVRHERAQNDYLRDGVRGPIRGGRPGQSRARPSHKAEESAGEA